MNGAECLLRTLVANGLDLCLMNPGTSEMQFVSALDRVEGMRPVLCLFEGVCSGAADGYARMTGRPAATLLHLGPGLGNALANFHNARKARSPVVSIVGEHATQHRRHDAPLTADVAAFARTVSGCVRVIESAGEVGDAASAVVRAAFGPPGHVSTLIVPADFSWSEAGPPGAASPKPHRRLPGAATIRGAARLVRSGRSVGLFLSGTTLFGRGLEAAGRLAAAGVRVVSDRFAARSEGGRGRFQPVRIPYFPEAAEAALEGLENLVLVEAAAPVSFFAYPGRRSELAPEDCRTFMLASAAEDGAAALEALAEECSAPRLVRTAPPPTPGLPAPGPLTASGVGLAVAALLPEGAIISDEMVSSGEQVWPHLRAAAPHDHLPVTGGSIGQGLPVAVGAALACPDRKVVALEADGSGMYTLQALWTMARERLDVVAVILANRRYRILDVEIRRTGATEIGRVANQMIDIGQPPLDWVKLANAQGVPGARAATTEEFIAHFRAAVAERGPHLIEAVIPG